MSTEVQYINCIYTAGWFYGSCRVCVCADFPFYVYIETEGNSLKDFLLVSHVDFIIELS